MQLIILMKQQINIAKEFLGFEGTNASYNSIFIVVFAPAAVVL